MLFSLGPFAHAAEVQPLHVGVDFGAAGDDEGRDLDLVSLEDVGREDHVGDLAAGAASRCRRGRASRRGSCGRCPCCPGECGLATIGSIVARSHSCS